MTTIAPKCAKCGNDGSEAGLYLTIDAKFQPGKGWELEERTDDGGMQLDCLACDHRTDVDDGTKGGPASGFPYGHFITGETFVLAALAGNMLTALKDAERFLVGFEDDETQKGISGEGGLLTRIQHIVCSIEEGAAIQPHPALELVDQIARMKNSVEADGEDMGNDEAMDGLIRWARNINGTTKEA